jgi:SAM-dependent methyltransferase
METRNCRICGSERYSVILDYGRVALAGSLISSLEDAALEQKYQLTLVLCEDCKHVQIREIVDPSLIFTNYPWETSVSSSIVAYCHEFATRVPQLANAPASGFVVEIASNDGTLLGEFARRGFRVLGVDPARRIAENATAKGIPTWPTFFNLSTAQRVVDEHGLADIIIGRNVLAHVADLRGFVDGVRTLLKRGGTAVIEVPSLIPMFKELQYDQVYHEHIGYHSLDSIRRLGERHGLRLVHSERSPLHGGSIRAYLAHRSDVREAAACVNEMLDEEADEGVLHAASWMKFGDRVREQKRLLRAELEAVRARGDIVVGYGASGKGQSLIQFCELDERHVNYVVDKAPIKHGKFTPGSHIPIFDPAHMKTAGVDVLLLCSWNLAQEILAQEGELHMKGVQFLHPIPVPHYL